MNTKELETSSLRRLGNFDTQISLIEGCFLRFISYIFARFLNRAGTSKKADDKNPHTCFTDRRGDDELLKHEARYVHDESSKQAVGSRSDRKPGTFLENPRSQISK